MKKLPLYRPTDRTERELVEQLRAKPADGPTRSVYADWLEERGDPDRAKLVRVEAELPEAERVELAQRTEVEWRAVVAQAPIAGCAVSFGPSCPKRWDAMARTDAANVRTCRGCEQPIYYCTSIEEAAHHGRRRECIAIDSTLIVASAEAAYVQASRPPLPQVQWVGMAVPQPPSGVSDQPPSGIPPAPELWLGEVDVQVPVPDDPPAPPQAPSPAKPGLVERLGGLFRKKP